MSSPRTESSRLNRAVRWLLPAALLALTPKCLLCLAAYAGLGAALGLGGPEICGASTNSSGGWLAVGTLVGAVAAASAWSVRRCRLTRAEQVR